MDNSQVEIKKESSSNVLLPGIKCPPFCNIQAVMEDGVTVKSFTSFEKKYVVLVFFPLDSSVAWTTASSWLLRKNGEL